MPAQYADIFVTSHTARDLLQNAALFKTDKLVVWEYVSNGLQYVDQGVPPVVRVTLDTKRKRISITDNGRGMDWAGLQNFFIMHGENIDRLDGRPGRGRFGTGKSAALGIAGVMRITTTRGQRRSRVELKASDVEEMKAQDPVPVKALEREVPTTTPNGTLVEIEDVHLRSLDQAGIIKYIERHLAKWPKNVTVYVNNHECEFAEPAIAFERRYVADGTWREKIGAAELTIKVSKAPLDEDMRGVAIFANGVWYETTLAGCEGREMAQYLFGEIDVARLDNDKTPIQPFDMSRSMRLNPNNELVQNIYAFVGLHLEAVRRELLEEEKKRRASEEARKLERQASEIAEVINEDFEAFRKRIAKARASGSGGRDAGHMRNDGGGMEDDLLYGDELPAELIAETGTRGAIGCNASGGEDARRLLPDVVAGSPDAERLGKLVGQGERGDKPRGGFQVKFERMGEAASRAQYMRDERTIYVNLDHPQLVAARGLVAVDDAVFRRLAYEVAFSEYAVGLASELAARDEYLDPSDPIVDIRETLNRVARKAAYLYQA